MKTLLHLLRHALLIYAEQLYHRLWPVASLRRELDEAQRHNLRLHTSVTKHLRESVILLSELDRIERRAEYLEQRRAFVTTRAWQRRGEYRALAWKVGETYRVRGRVG